ncbi:MAG: hypothetical protein G01um101430_294 [Parcubacteria group bacterium Gr01-1014_30]|nr:MAG: hypothetical protein G01um101430_294 [Parcubacteria group bacterium Gr01-1014_30]
MLAKTAKLVYFFAVSAFLLLPVFGFAQTVSFNVDPAYDLLSRTQIEAELVRTTQNLYFYIEKSWWNNLASQEQNNIRIVLFELGEEFTGRIYPVLTTTFGQEPKPGIDRDEKITILIHQMRQDAGGYFNSGDAYSRLQAPRSNEREMVYLSANRVTSPNLKSFLAHEFVHLITINQKDLLRRVTEEIWLNEARAELAPTLLGYDEIFQGSNLEARMIAFLEKPTLSLTEWLNLKYDYGAVNLFAQYIVDHYGTKILVDSLQSSKIGIASLEEALLRQGVSKTFAQLFSDWAITLLLNDCSVGQRYCYLNQHLKNLKIVPTIYFLPRTETTISTVHGSTFWSLNWHRLVGGEGQLSLEFEGNSAVSFEVPLALCDRQNLCSITFLALDSQEKGRLQLADFSQKYNSLTILPFVKSKTEGFDGEQRSFSFSWKTSVGQGAQTEAELRNQLLSRVAQLRAQLAQLQAQLSALFNGQPLPGAVSCTQLNNNLYFGVRNSQEVRCLQEFLKTEGVYPEGLVTGNFLSLTRTAVIRFQEKYASEILTPFGLQQGTGYVGQATRAKLNQLLQ